MPDGRRLTSSPPARTHAVEGARSTRRLGAFLCWAVVFADIGTSVYYVPGILYGQVGLLAGLFVALTLVAFLLLTLKYAEVSVRFPQGGGVVTVSAQGLNPWAGALGGMFILVDYFLTAAISADSGLHYLSAVLHDVAPFVLVLAVVVIALLGVLNWWGIKQSAIVSLVVAVVACASDLVILAAVLLNVPVHAIGQAFAELLSPALTPVTLLTGFAGAFLAFSGLESVSQLSPVMRLPRRRTVTVALALVFVTVGLTSPLLTIFSTTLLTTCTPQFTLCSPQVLHAALAAHAPQPDPNQFISELAALAGGTSFGRALEIVTAIAAAALLVFASNTAIIGAYHVVVALARMRFLPPIFTRKSRWRETPSVAIFLVTAIPMLVLVAVQGDVTTLGAMYAFGLLGAFSLTCLSLDVIRWRERRGAVAIRGHAEQDGEEPPTGPDSERAQGQGRVSARRGAWANANFALGMLTTLLVGVAWFTNLQTKPLATEFGGGITLVGLAIAVLYYHFQRWQGTKPVFPTILLQRIPHALLVVLSAGSPHTKQIVTAACGSARGRPVVFLYIGKPQPRRPHLMQFNDPYLYDEPAQHAFSLAHHVCAGSGVTPTYFVYSVGGPTAVLHARLVIQPEEIVAEALMDPMLPVPGPRDAVSFQEIDGVRVAHYIPQ
jgi:amino acid transporter